MTTKAPDDLRAGLIGIISELKTMGVMKRYDPAQLRNLASQLRELGERHTPEDKHD